MRLRTASVVVFLPLLALAVACGDDPSALLRDGAGGPEGAAGAPGAGGATGGPGAGAAPGTGTSGAPGDVCRSASSLDVFDDAGHVDPARYRALAARYASAEAVGYRFGHDSTHYHPTKEIFPTAHLPGDHPFSHGTNQPLSTWQVGGPFQSDPGYNSTAGQVLFVPDDARTVGLHAVQFLDVSSAVVSQKPQLAWTAYGEGAPDQSTKNASMVAAHGGPFRDAVAVARPVTTDQWTQDAVVAFQDGTLLTTGTYASGGSSTVLARLPKGLVPTAIALTTNNELALVTVWDTENVRGGLAVVALGGPSKRGWWGDWSQVYPGLHSYGLFSFMKVLGVVWIDGMVAPIAVSASADLRNPVLGAPEPKTLDLSVEATRSRFRPGGDLAVRHAAAGFAVVMSRSEKKVAFVDLQPIFEQITRGYFGTRADFDKTRTMGQGPNEWPYAFSTAPTSAPVVVKVASFAACPTAVATTANVFAPHNFPDRDDDRHARPSASYRAHAVIGTEDGTLHVMDVGGLHDDTPADANAIREVSTATVGKNPTSITPLGRSLEFFGEPVDWVVVSRGDRRVDLLRGKKDASTLTSWKTIQDSRLLDPVSVDDVTWFGNYVPLVEVADYAGKQVVAYRYDAAKLAFHGDRVLGLGADGKAAFECAGTYPVPGGALFTSNTNVP